MSPVDQVTAGSISSGTMQEGDLITTFLGELGRLDPERAIDICHKHDSYVIEDLADSQRCLLDDLITVLDEYTPEDCYFGASVGDGSDYGFWPVEE